MKKLFILFALISLTIAVAAQESVEPQAEAESSAKKELPSELNTIYSSENGTFRIHLMSHMGYGFYFVDTQDYLPKQGGSGEFFMNLLQFELRPGEKFGIDLSADFLFRHFNSEDQAFYQNAEGLIKASTAVLPVGAQDIRSNFCTFGANFPLMMHGYFGNFIIGAGAECGLAFLGTSEYKYRNGNRHTVVTEDKPKINTFTYGIVGELAYSALAVYFKYYPKSMRILPEGSVDQSFFTVGLKMGF